MRRPLAPYFGGKWKLAQWILQFFPAHETYVEAFGGVGTCLLRKPRSSGEVWNDLNAELVNLFRVLRNREQAAALIEELELTPFARQEYLEAYVPAENELEQARRTLFRMHATFGSPWKGRPGGMRAGLPGKNPRQWARFPDHVAVIVERLQGVLVEQLPAIEVIRKHDGPHTLIYADPPYLHSTRTAKNEYRVEMTDQQHVELAQVLNAAQGMVVLSGYPSAVYDALYPGWECHTRPALALSHAPRLEALWLNPAAVQALAKQN